MITSSNFFTKSFFNFEDKQPPESSYNDCSPWPQADLFVDRRMEGLRRPIINNQNIPKRDCQSLLEERTQQLAITRRNQSKKDQQHQAQKYKSILTPSAAAKVFFQQPIKPLDLRSSALPSLGSKGKIQSTKHRQSLNLESGLNFITRNYKRYRRRLNTSNKFESISPPPIQIYKKILIAARRYAYQSSLEKLT